MAPLRGPTRVGQCATSSHHQEATVHSGFSSFGVAGRVGGRKGCSVGSRQVKQDPGLGLSAESSISPLWVSDVGGFLLDLSLGEGRLRDPGSS